MHTSNNNNLDAVIIGGGPAGSTVATLLAQRGFQTRIYERDAFPRFHIGESLMPETYWTFQRLGVLDQLKASSFTKKHSVQFVSEGGKESAPFFFFDVNPHESSQTWQVVRSEFDAMLLENARKNGVDVKQGYRVREIVLDGDRATGVRISGPDGDQEVQAKVVVDASGQSALLANRLKLLERDKTLKKGSVWTYYQGALRNPGLNEGATLVLHTEGKKGWFWYIPLPNDIVSVGVVSDIGLLFEGRKSHEAIFNENLEKCLAVKDRVAPGKRITDFYATKDFSYKAKRCAGENWVLIGDAFGFLDPIYSSGVFLALKSGEMAADAIADGLEKGDLSAAQLGRWAPEFLQGMEAMRKLVYAFYQGFSFGNFIRNHPEYKRHLTDLLVGDLFKEGVTDIFDVMKQYVDV